jgi:hypothetical protein
MPASILYRCRDCEVIIFIAVKILPGSQYKRCPMNKSSEPIKIKNGGIRN